VRRKSNSSEAQKEQSQTLLPTIIPWQSAADQQ